MSVACSAASQNKTWEEREREGEREEEEESNKDKGSVWE